MAKLPLAVRSDYYRALLILSRRDRIIDDREREYLIRIGEILDFDRRFCEATIDELLSNPHLTRNPIVFSDAAVRDCFFRDALRVAYSDGSIHPTELRWLRKMAHANGKSDQWLDSIVREFVENRGAGGPGVPLEIQKHT